MFRFNWFNITWTNTHAEEVMEEIEDFMLCFSWVAVIKPEDESFRKFINFEPITKPSSQFNTDLWLHSWFIFIL